MVTHPLLDGLAKHWWVLLIRGILAVLFGFLAFALPGLTLVTLVLLFGLYVLADGLTALFAGGSSRAWWLMLVGVLGIFVGIYTFLNPGITAVALLYVIAVWAIIHGVFEVITAIQLRKEISNEWALIFAGIISILFGLLLVANPAAGALAMVWLIGIFAFVFGFFMIVLAFRVRELPKRFDKLAGVA